MQDFVKQRAVWVKPDRLLRYKIVDVPLQSLFFALKEYRNLMEHYFYFVETGKEQADAICKVQVQLVNYEYAHFNGRVTPLTGVPPAYRTHFHRD
jgi:hypothetical protein